MLLDAFMLHDESTVEKPNCLEMNGILVAIDHGNAFAGMDSEGAASADYVALGRLSRIWTHHVFRDAVRRRHGPLLAPEAVARLASILETSVRELGDRWPSELKIAKTRSGHEIMSETLEFLVRRRGHTATLWHNLLKFLEKSDA